MPVFLVAGLLALLLGLLAVALVLVVSLVALSAMAAAGLLSPRSRSRNGATVQITRRRP